MCLIRLSNAADKPKFAAVCFRREGVRNVCVSRPFSHMAASFHGSRSERSTVAVTFASSLLPHPGGSARARCSDTNVVVKFSRGASARAVRSGSGDGRAPRRSQVRVTRARNRDIDVDGIDASAANHRARVVV